MTGCRRAGFLVVGPDGSAEGPLRAHRAPGIGAPQWMDRAGAFYAIGLPAGPGSEGEFQGTDSSAVQHLRPGAQRWGTASFIPVARNLPTAARDGMPHSPPYACTVEDDGTVGIVRPDPYRVRLELPNGTRQLGPRVPYEPVPVTEAHKEEWRRWQAEPRPTVGGVRGQAGTHVRISVWPVREPAAWPEGLPPYLDAADSTHSLAASLPVLIAPSIVLLKTDRAAARTWTPSEEWPVAAAVLVTEAEKVEATPMWVRKGWALLRHSCPSQPRRMLTAMMLRSRGTTDGRDRRILLPVGSGPGTRAPSRSGPMVRVGGKPRRTGSRPGRDIPGGAWGICLSSLRRGVVGLLAAAVLAGCEDPSDTHSLRMLESVGPEVRVIRSGPSDPQAPPEGWRVQEILRLGGQDPSESAEVFGDIRGVELDDDGNVYVLDRQAYTVRVFRPDGVHVRDIGGRGEGPGEVLFPSGLVMWGDDRLLVRDRSRYTVFELDGTPAETLTRTAGGGGDPIITKDGRIYQSAVFSYDPLSRTGDYAYLGAVAREGAMVVVDTIWRPEEVSSYWWVDFGPTGEGGSWPVPFAAESQDHPDPRGGFWRGITDGYRFVRYSAAGEAEVVVERAGPRGEPVTASDRSRALEALGETFGERIQVDLSEIPERKPLWSAFFVDGEGRLWVERYRDPDVDPLLPREWEVYDSAGSYLGMLELPMESTPRPKIRGGQMVGTVRDSLDVQHVVLFSLDTG